MTRSRPVARFGLLACALLLSACGGGGDGASAVPRRVPVALVPSRLLADSLGVFENRSASTRKVVQLKGEDSLVDDTRIWEVRRGQRLVGTLQISTVDPRVKLVDDDVRDRFARQLIVGQRQQIRVGDVEAYRAVNDDKTVVLWFARDLYLVLQTKGSELDTDMLFAELVEYQSDQPAWKPLPRDVEFE